MTNKQLLNWGRAFQLITLPLFLILALFGYRPALAQSYSAATFYVVAHEDDWQLLMTPNAYDDVVAPGAKVVFVHLTAGNGDFGTGPANSPYYIAREEGAQRAVRFMANVDTSTETPVLGAVTVNGHAVLRYRYKNTASYFLRLPDGGFDGSGFASSGSGSLSKLRLGVASLAAIDGSTTYSDWNDLVTTLESIVLQSWRARVPRMSG